MKFDLRICIRYLSWKNVGSLSQDPEFESRLGQNFIQLEKIQHVKLYADWIGNHRNLFNKTNIILKYKFRKNKRCSLISDKTEK